MIRVVLPHHLRNLSGTGRELELDVDEPVTQRTMIDALESTYPVLKGTIRDPATQRRRPFIRFYADEQDLSHEPPDSRLPNSVASGHAPLYVVGAMAGG
jgi:hypothetical protein